MSSDPRYPIGEFESVLTLTPEKRSASIEAIAEVPGRLRLAVADLGDAQLDTPYREGGWTVRQLVHHIADSHMNAVMRFKLTLTEDEPTIQTYEENLWAELADTKRPPIDSSLGIIDNLHARWVILLRSIAPDQFSRKFRHPQWGCATVDFLLAQYAWHGRHHVAQITSLRERRGWR